MRASIQASGTPKIVERPVAHSEQMIDNLSAVGASPVLSAVNRLLHGALHSRPASGSTKKMMATEPSTGITSGTLRLRLDLDLDRELVDTAHKIVSS